MAITLRNTKGLPLTHEELDGNFTDLNNRIGALESASDSDNQTLSFTGTTLTISSGNSVDLSSLLDDTDTNTFVSSASFDNATGTLTLTKNDATTVTVSLDGRYLTSETDSQTLSLVGDTLSISGGNSVDLSKYTDSTFSGDFDDLTNNPFTQSIVSIPTPTTEVSYTGDVFDFGTGTTIDMQNCNLLLTGATVSGLTLLNVDNITIGVGGGINMQGADIGAAGTINAVTVNAGDFIGNLNQSQTLGLSSYSTTISQDGTYTKFAKVDIIDDGLGGTNTLTRNVLIDGSSLRFDNDVYSNATLSNNSPGGDLYVQAGNGNPVDGQRNGGNLYLWAGARASGATDGGHIIMNSNSGDIFIGPLGNTQNIRIGGGPGYSGSTGSTLFYGVTDFSNATVDWAAIVGNAIQNNGLPSNTFTTGDFEVRGNINLNGSRTISPILTNEFLFGSDLTIRGGTSGDPNAVGGDLFLDGGAGAGAGIDGTVRINQNTSGGVWIGKSDGTADDIQTYSRLRIHRGVTEDYAAKADATGVVEHDCDAGHLFYHTSPDANWTVNLTNLNVYNNMATNITIVIVQGDPAYYPNALQIGGSAQTILWQGGATPTPTASGVDVVTFSIIYNGSNYTVLGQMTDFSAVP